MKLFGHKEVQNTVTNILRVCLKLGQLVHLPMNEEQETDQELILEPTNKIYL